ncbi:MAG: tetratricopeptide repeat protein [Crocinitomicaceae bacterium]
MKNVFLFAALVLGLSLNANNLVTSPPDSNANIIEKSTSALAIAEGRAFLGEGNVRQALLKFREAIKKDPKNAQGHYYLGECNFLLYRYENALEAITDAFKIKPDVSDEIHYMMAQCEHVLGNYEKAKEHYTAANTEIKSAQRKRDLRIEDMIAQCEFGMSEKKKESAISVKQMEGDINSIYPQYGFIWGDSIAYFTSRRPNTTGGGINPSDNVYFEDIYGATWNESTKQYDKVSNEISRINSNGFESISYITPDGMMCLMTVNNEMARTKEDKVKYKTGSSDIWYSKKSKRGTWNSPRPFGKEVNTSFYEGTAVLSPDGETMYFVSERKGGKGESDIWMANKAGNDWGKPVNLGDSINTPFRETTPFITSDGKYLLFASKGHEQNMGGYDIFVSKKGRDGWEKAVNVGAHINSETDDFYFRIEPDGQTGHLSRIVVEEGAGNYKILEVDLSKLNLEELTKRKK